MALNLKPFFIVLGSIILLLLIIALVRQLGFEKEFENWTQKNQPVVKILVTLLFMIFAAAAVPVFIHFFISLQYRAGNGNSALVVLLNRHGMKLVYGTWLLFGLGLLVSLPVMIKQGFFSNQG